MHGLKTREDILEVQPETDVQTRVVKKRPRKEASKETTKETKRKRQLAQAFAAKERAVKLFKKEKSPEHSKSRFLRLYRDLASYNEII